MAKRPIAVLKSNPVPHIALLLTNLFFAINLSVVKYLIGNGYIQAFGLNFMRIGITAGLLWIMVLFQRRYAPVKKKDLFRFAGCAVTGIVINQLLFIKGLSYTYPIHAALLMLTAPILITFIAAWFLKEKITVYKLIGLVLGFSGAVILIRSGVSSSVASNVLLGDGLIIINAISYTFYFVLVKPLMRDYHPITVIRIIFTLGFFIALPFCWNEFIQTNWQLFAPFEWLMLALVVLGGTFFAYLFNIYGIQQLGAAIAGTYIYAQPVFATVIAYLFLHESIEAYKLIAAVCIFTGVYLANKKEKNKLSEV